MQRYLPGRTMLAVAAPMALAAALCAQQGSTGGSVESGKQVAGTISVESRLVNIPVVVRDGKGALVLNLKKEDFSLEVDGRAQTIRYFDLETDLPLTVGLLVDTGGSARNELTAGRTARPALRDDVPT